MYVITFNSCLPVYFTYFKIPRTACYSTKLRLSSKSTQESSYINLSISIIIRELRTKSCLTYPSTNSKNFGGTRSNKSSNESSNNKII